MYYIYMNKPYADWCTFTFRLIREKAIGIFVCNHTLNVGNKYFIQQYIQHIIFSYIVIDHSENKENELAAAIS